MNYRYCNVNLLGCLAFNAKVLPLKINYIWQVFYNTDLKEVVILLFWTTQLDGLRNGCSWVSVTNGTLQRRCPEPAPVLRGVARHSIFSGISHWARLRPLGSVCWLHIYHYLQIKHRPRRWEWQDVTGTFMVRALFCMHVYLDQQI